MREELLPLFPLPVVLLPRTSLPLHIFEDRYKEMIATVIADETEFGVVQAREGGIVNVGCSASVDRVVYRYPDGRMDIVTVGKRRFEVLELVEGKAYLRGKVRFFDDIELGQPSEELRQRALQAYASVRAATGQEAADEPEWSDPQLSFQLAQILNDLDFRQQLLAVRSESERLKQLTNFFPVYILKWRHSEHVRLVAPRNGHSKSILPDAS